MLFEAHLHQLREALNISQQELAKTLGISQPSVAAIEGRGNELKISTLKRYVEAMGGTLRPTLSCRAASTSGLRFKRRLPTAPRHFPFDHRRQSLRGGRELVLRRGSGPRAVR